MKVLAAFMAAAALIVAGCGSSDDNSTSTSGGGSSTTASKGKPIKVGLVTDVGRLNDKSFNQSSWEGVLQAQQELGIEAKSIETVDTKDYAQNIGQFVSEGYDVIVTVGFALGEATAIAAKDKYAGKLLANDGVVGTAVGLGSTGNVVIKVYLTRAAAATVATPTQMTTATRTPVSITGIASGSSTIRKTCPSVIPIATAASRSFGSMLSMPVTVLRITGSSAYRASAMIAALAPMPINEIGMSRPNSARLGTVCITFANPSTGV